MPPVGSSNHIDNMEHHVALRARKVIPFVDDGSGNAVMQVTLTQLVYKPCYNYSNRGGLPNLTIIQGLRVLVA